MSRLKIQLFCANNHIWLNFGMIRDDIMQTAGTFWSTLIFEMVDNLPIKVISM